MLDLTQNSIQSANRGSLVRSDVSLWVLAMFLVGVFFAAEHEMHKAGTWTTEAEEEVTIDEFVDFSAGGSRLRQVSILSFAAIGMFCLASPGGRTWNPSIPVLALMTLTGLWCAASILWSIEPGASARRLAVAVCCMLGAVGLARQLTARDLCRLIVVSGLSLILLGLLIDMASGGRPWDGAYRFGGTLHPNTMACYCAMVCLAGYCLAMESKKESKTPAAWWGVVVIAGILLLLTRSRTSLFALGMVWLCVWWVRSSLAVRRWSLAAVVTSAAVAMIVLGASDRATRLHVLDVVFLGRSEGATSLTGRVPLWLELTEYAGERPLTGYGFEAFWSPDHMQDLFESQEWAMKSAHSAYLELILTIGLIGFLMVLSVVLLSTWRAHRQYERTRLAGYGFVFGALVFGLANGLLEALYVRTYFPSVMTFCGLAMVALFELHRNEQQENAAPSPQQAANRLRTRV